MIRKGLNLLFTTVLLSILSIEGVWSQSSTRNLGGTVVDENGEALIGVAVRVADTMQGTTTDVNGSFQLALPQGKTIIEISYLGYQTQRIDTRNKPDNLAVRMKPEDVSLNEVVVIGYGTVKKRDLTGAVTSVKNADITVAPTGNIMEALQGKIAGMDITKTSSQVGANPSILLRGSRSIYGDNSPLFVIDGIPGNYSDVNPQDVESVDVLKDASATAIYGSAGANGVVI
ncbi:MAG: TonB-dependent receptor plug domain-containing protein, partial [Prevotellaceae bacterium]|nr:TonB-dependent receptor plug domain-containing protein [Prevotellaceae bacterium]